MDQEAQPPDVVKWCQERERDHFVGDNRGVLGDNKHSMNPQWLIAPCSQPLHNINKPNANLRM